MLATFSKEDLRQRVRWYIGLRWFFVLSLGLAAEIPQFLQEGFVSQVRQNLIIILLVLVINAVFLFISSYRHLRYGIYQALAIAQLALDIIIVASLVYFNGGIEGIIVTLYVIPIVMSGALLGPLSIYMTGLAAAVTYDAVVMLDYFHIITPQSILAPALHRNTNYVVQTLFFAPAMLLTITAVTAYVSKLVRGRTELATKLDVVSTEWAQTEAIVKTMGSALVAVDRGGKITTVNDAFEQLTGWNGYEVIGNDLDKVLPLFDENSKGVPKAERPIYKLLFNNSGDYTIPSVQRISRYYYAKKDGKKFPFVSSIAPITVSGKVIGATCVFEDASSIKQIDQLKTNFLALASHQLKTPISEIKGYAENMLHGIGGVLSPEQTKYVSSIQEVTVRANKLVADLLDASVLEQGAIMTNLEPVKLSQATAKVVKIYEDRIKQKSLTLKVIDPDQNIVVQADKEKLVEIIGNVVANAVNYTKPNTTVTIEIKKDADYGLVLVSDQGAGMEKQVLDNIFSKDSILSSAPVAEGGTGIGLYLAKQLLTLQKGEINVISSTSNGTTMSIKIPLTRNKKHNGRSS